jgi:hypothetical protein
MVWSNKVPEWFLEHFEQGQHIQEEFGLSPKDPLTLALALDLALGSPAAPALKVVRGTLDKAKKYLAKARKELLSLGDIHLKALTPDCLELVHQSDGAMVLHMEPDTIATAVQDIDQLMLRLEAVEIQRGQGGRRISPLHCAVRQLVEFVERDNPNLTRAQRVQLCHQLFDVVRIRHGHQSHSCDRDVDDVPGYMDLIISIEDERLRLGKPDKI